MSTKVEQAIEKDKAAFKDKVDEAIQQDLRDAKITQLEGKLNELEAILAAIPDRMKTTIAQINNQARSLSDKNFALEQSLLSMGKIVTATIGTFVKKGLVLDSEVMETLREDEDKREGENVDRMVSAGILALDESIGPESAIVLKQETLVGDKKAVVSNCRYTEIASVKEDDPFRKELLGKKAGEQVALSTEGITTLFTVKAVYKFAESGQVSEVAHASS